MRPRSKSARGGVDLMMTPMIDVVFQLLVFFVMSFRIVVEERELAIHMPRESDAVNGPMNDAVRMRLDLEAAPGGELAAIRLNGEHLGGDFGPLKRRLAAWNASSETAWDLRTDPRLRYEFVHEAIDALGVDSPPVALRWLPGR